MCVQDSSRGGVERSSRPSWWRSPPPRSSKTTGVERVRLSLHRVAVLWNFVWRVPKLASFSVASVCRPGLRIGEASLSIQTHRDQFRVHSHMMASQTTPQSNARRLRIHRLRTQNMPPHRSALETSRVLSSRDIHHSDKIRLTENISPHLRPHHRNT